MSQSQSIVQLQQQQSLTGHSHSNLDQRTNEISAIAQSITDLADLFKDLSSLVIDQGTLLDRVDYNVEQMGVDVKGAVEELKEATTSVASAQRATLAVQLTNHPSILQLPTPIWQMPAHLLPATPDRRRRDPDCVQAEQEAQHPAAAAADHSRVGTRTRRRRGSETGGRA